MSKRTFDEHDYDDDVCFNHTASVPLPTAEQVCEATATDQFLMAALRFVAKHQNMGCGGVDLHEEWIEEDADKFNVTDAEYVNDTSGRATRLAMIPYLQRFGFQITRFHSEDIECLMSIRFPGHATKKKEVLRDEQRFVESDGTTRRFTFYYGRSFRQVRLRGLVKCIPRLLGWARIAKIRAMDPTRHPKVLERFVAQGQQIFEQCAEQR
jgi:hypothetical protein